MNATAPEGIRTKLAQIFLSVMPQTVQVLKVMCSTVKVTEMVTAYTSTAHHRLSSTVVASECQL